MPRKGDEQTPTPAAPRPRSSRDLRHQPAEGVAHDDRGCVEAADDRLVVVGDLPDAEALQSRGVLADRLNVAVVDSRPSGREHLVAASFEALLPACQLSGVIQRPWIRTIVDLRVSLRSRASASSVVMCFSYAIRATPAIDEPDGPEDIRDRGQLSASFQPVGSWRPDELQRAHMRPAPIRIPGTPSHAGDRVRLGERDADSTLQAPVKA